MKLLTRTKQLLRSPKIGTFPQIYITADQHLDFPSHSPFSFPFRVSPQLNSGQVLALFADQHNVHEIAAKISPFPPFAFPPDFPPHNSSFPLQRVPQESDWL